MSALPSSVLKLSRQIVKLAREKKARQLVALRVEKLVSYASVMIIMSSTSDRHAHALADHVLEELKGNGLLPLGVEGRQSGKWILLDYGDVVVHIMQKEAREYYDLEGLWQDAEALELGRGED